MKPTRDPLLICVQIQGGGLKDAQMVEEGQRQNSKFMAERSTVHVMSEQTHKTGELSFRFKPNVFKSESQSSDTYFPCRQSCVWIRGYQPIAVEAHEGIHTCCLLATLKFPLFSINTFTLHSVPSVCTQSGSHSSRGFVLRTQPMPFSHQHKLKLQ